MNEIISLYFLSGCQSVNAILGVNEANKQELGKSMVEVSKKRNSFLTKRSAVSSKSIENVHLKKSEIKSHGGKTEVPVDVNNKNHFEPRIGKLHWQDKKRVKKFLNKKGPVALK